MTDTYESKQGLKFTSAELDQMRSNSDGVGKDLGAPPIRPPHAALDGIMGNNRPNHHKAQCRPAT